MFESPICSLIENLKRKYYNDFHIQDLGDCNVFLSSDKKQDIYMVWKVYKMPNVICNIDKGFKLTNIIEIDLASGQPSLLLNL